MLEPGMKAPEFTLKNQEGKEVSCLITGKESDIIFLQQG